MLAWIGTNAALIPVSVAGAARVSYGTVAVVHASDRVGVTLRAHPTRVTDAGVVSVAEQSCFARRADAEKRCNAVDACGTLGAGRRGTVINVLRAVGPTPAVNTHADVAANQVGASPSILASVWLQAALVDVFGTVLASPLWGALTVVGINPIHADSSISTLMTRTVVNIVLTVSPIETWKAMA